MEEERVTAGGWGGGVGQVLLADLLTLSALRRHLATLAAPRAEGEPAPARPKRPKKAPPSIAAPGGGDEEAAERAAEEAAAEAAALGEAEGLARAAMAAAPADAGPALHLLARVLHLRHALPPGAAAGPAAGRSPRGALAHAFRGALARAGRDPAAAAAVLAARGGWEWAWLDRPAEAAATLREAARRDPDGPAAALPLALEAVAARGEEGRAEGEALVRAALAGRAGGRHLARILRALAACESAEPPPAPPPAPAGRAGPERRARPGRAGLAEMGQWAGPTADTARSASESDGPGPAA
jgi:hypothetical protein